MNLIPEGFKAIPSNPDFAISMAGLVINISTGRTISKHVDDAGKEYVVFYTYNSSFGKNERTISLITTLIEEAFGVPETGAPFTWWRDIPGYTGYQISDEGTVIVKANGLPVAKGASSNGEAHVHLHRSGLDLFADKLEIRYLLELTFPEKLRRVVARNGKQILRGFTLHSDQNSTNQTAFQPDGMPQLLLNTTLWDIQWEDEFDLLWEAKEEVWLRIEGYPDYEMDSSKRVRNRFNHEEPTVHEVRSAGGGVWLCVMLRSLSGDRDWLSLDHIQTLTELKLLRDKNA